MVPRRTWTSCGDGCLVAPTALPGGSPTECYTQIAEGTERAGELYYRVSLVGDDFWIDEVSRASDDAPVTLFRSRSGRQPGGCDIIGDFDAPFLFGWSVIGSPPGPVHTALATATLGAPANWMVPPWTLPPLGERLFAFDGGWGLIDTGSSLVEAALTTGAGNFTTLYQGVARQRAPVGRGPLVTWIDWDGWSLQKRAHIRSWTASSGSQILVDGVPDYDVDYVALSDSKIVWMGSTGLQSMDGKTESAALYWSPWTTSASGIQRHVGTGPLPHTATAPGPLVTFGDLAATTVAWVAPDGSVPVHVVVANLLTGQIWDIPSRPNNFFGGVMAMNASTLLLKETTYTAQNNEPQRIVRLDLSKLDTLVNGLQ